MKVVVKMLPKYKKLILQVDPSQGAAAIAASISAPKGYVFREMDRRGAKVTIKFLREDLAEKTP